MDRYHVQQAVRAARLSALEEGTLLGGPLLVAAGVVAALVGGDAGGTARALGSAGLAALAICAASRAVRRYRAGVTASLPTTVARVAVRARPRRVLNAATAGVALGLPAAAALALVAVAGWGWLLVAGVALLGCAGMLASWVADAGRGEAPYARSSAAASELLARLCMRADMPVPELVVVPGSMAMAWTTRGRVHVTRRLVELLDTAELEAVLAHELAHLAHRDAAVMEICAAPSRLLLAFARSMHRRATRWLRSDLAFLIPYADMVVFSLAALATLFVPPALLLGWTSRLSVLGGSRAREYSADAAAATLTGRPSALASALMKLDRQREWTPRADLRQAEPYAVLCIVGVDRSRLGRLLSTHPPTPSRVRRLRAMEARLQGRAG